MICRRIRRRYYFTSVGFHGFGPYHWINESHIRPAQTQQTRKQDHTSIGSNKFGPRPSTSTLIRRNPVHKQVDAGINKTRKSVSQEATTSVSASDHLQRASNSSYFVQESYDSRMQHNPVYVYCSRAHTFTRGRLITPE